MKPMEVIRLEGENREITDDDRVMLRGFFEERWLSCRTNDRIAVGCAIRTWVANMPYSDFGHDASLLTYLCRHFSKTPVEHCIETTKMFVRKLTANRRVPQARRPMTLLVEKDLYWIICDWYNRVGEDKYHKYAVVVLDAVLALRLLKSSCVPNVNAMIKICPKWFLELLERRWEKIKQGVQI